MCIIIKSTEKPCIAMSGRRNHQCSLRSVFLVCCSVVSFSLGCLARYYLVRSGVVISLPGELTNKVPIEAAKVNKYYHWSTNSLGKYVVEYVESIVHPAMLAHPNPSNILIVGGAKEDVDVQAILTEVLRHKSVERVHVVESLVAKTPAEVDDGSVTYNSSDSEETIVEYLESLESILHRKQRNKFNFDSHSTFDIVILLHPYDLFSDIKKHNHRQDEVCYMELSSSTPTAMLALAQDTIMSPNGILVTHLGPSPYLNRRSVMELQDGCDGDDCDEHLQLKLIDYLTRHEKFHDVHIFEDANGPGYRTIRIPQSYVLLCKDVNCRRHWYAEESYMNYLIRKRLYTPPLYVDGSTFRRYNRPPKSWESLFCSFSDNERECRYFNGFDPNVPNVPRNAFEVKPSSVGENVGRGLFTKVDIVKGSYFMQEVSVHQIKFSVQSISVIYDTREMLQEIYNDDDDDDEDDERDDVNDDGDDDDYDAMDETIDHSWEEANLGNDKYKFEIDSVIIYSDGYGYEVDAFGATGNHVDSGMNTFINHGCNKTFNFGTVLYVFDKEAGIVSSEFDYLMITENEADPNQPPPDDSNSTRFLFNPLLDRHLEHSLSAYEGSIVDIPKGNELLSNYVYYYGAECWKYGIRDLRAQCRGEKIGTIVQIEGKTSL